MIQVHLQKNLAYICKSLGFENQIFMTLYMYRHVPELDRDEDK